ncbi:MAG: hypothetical protein ABR497_09785 [Kiritimatiellia bacterium]|nr:hypothetical protein [Lentisphaerota bacterium]
MNKLFFFQGTALLAGKLVLISLLSAAVGPGDATGVTPGIIGWACGGLDSEGGVLLCTTNGTDWFRQGAGQLGANALGGAAAIGRRVWVVGEPADGYASIFHSADAGVTWERQGDTVTLPDAVLQKIWAVDRGVLWAVGPGGTVVTTADGGCHWRDVSVPGFTNMLQGVTAADALTAWVSGESDPATGFAGLFHTTDGGVSWTRQTDGAVTNVDHLLGLAALDKQRAWAIGACETVLATTNAGATWTLVLQGPMKDGNEICVLDDQRIWTANDAHLAWTTNGGAVWGSHNTAEYTMDVATPDGTSIWAVASGYWGGSIYHSPDGGASWFQQAESNTWHGLLTIEVTSLADPADDCYTLVCADFDGDGKADPAICRPRDGDWRIRLSTDGYAWTRLPDVFGGPDYEPLAADFDGDGKADPALYHAVSGNWRIRFSANGYIEHAYPDLFVSPGNTALAADFDGDGQADPAVCCPATGDWHVRRSAQGYELFTAAGLLGGIGITAAADDLDGDGQADPFTYNRQTGACSALLSGHGYARRETAPGFLNAPGWQAGLADFDGDGRGDPAAHDPRTGTLAIRLSGSQYEWLTLPGFLTP